MNTHDLRPIDAGVGEEYDCVLCHHLVVDPYQASACGCRGCHACFDGLLSCPCDESEHGTTLEVSELQTCVVLYTQRCIIFFKLTVSRYVYNS